MRVTCWNGASSSSYERKAARRHAEHPQGAVALQPPHGDPRAARRPARARRRTWCSCRRCRGSTSASPCASPATRSSRSTSSSPGRSGSTSTAATRSTTTATTATRSCRASASSRSRTRTCPTTASSAAACCIAWWRCPAGGATCICVCVHLSLHERGRSRQLEAISGRLEELASRDVPIIIAGDFNDWRHRATAILERRLGMTEVSVAHHGRAARDLPEHDAGPAASTGSTCAASASTPPRCTGASPGRCFRTTSRSARSWSAPRHGLGD